jgi:3',5'-cyclic AMP phosphodiesterase CpdA
MVDLISRRRFILSIAVSAVFFRCSKATSSQREPGLTFSVLSDPHGFSDGWINALTEIRDAKADPDPVFGLSEFVLVGGDQQPIDVTYEDFIEVFKSEAGAPDLIPAIGNHEADDTGGFPRGTAGSVSVPGEGPGQGAPGGRSGLDMPQGAGDQIGQGGGQLSGTTQGGRVMYGFSGSVGDPSIIDMEFISNKLIPAIPGVVRMSENSCSFYYDKENVRVISINAFSGEAGTTGIINDMGRTWTERAITSAPAAIDHVFIAIHAPAFPRLRNTTDLFVSNPEKRNAFWNMLIAHKDRVRAVFCGHTHYYSRLRVFDPSGPDANDPSKFPDEAGGIYQIDTGSTAMGEKNTFVKVKVEGKRVHFRTFEAENGAGKAFSLKEEWHIQGVAKAG